MKTSFVIRIKYHFCIKILKIGVVILLIYFNFSSCKKQDDWLNVKQNKSDVIPSTPEDFQALLDYDQIMNGLYPALGLLGCDNYYLTYPNWQSVTEIEQTSYIWAPDIFKGAGCSDWTTTYKLIGYANAVLDGLKKISPDSASKSKSSGLEGSALFYRAFAFYNLVQLFAKPYSATTASTDLSIPMPLILDPNIISPRSTVKQTYEQIINDMKQAEQLLPTKALYQTRPSKPAAESLLAKAYLNMGDYVNSEKYVNEALTNYNELIDYNILDPTSSSPFPVFGQNNEVIFYATLGTYPILFTNYLSFVDSVLYNSYDDNDLRKTLFYQDNGGGGINFKGAYSGSYLCFAGIATDELYLIRAESYARQGDIANAINDLNTLLITRWKTGTFIPITATDAADALLKILVERRKELPFTENIRWEDLRRLNSDPNFAITLTRNLNGQVYSLPPNDNRYVYPIPPDEIKYNNLPQNPR